MLLQEQNITLTTIRKGGHYTKLLFIVKREPSPFEWCVYDQDYLQKQWVNNGQS